MIAFAAPLLLLSIGVASPAPATLTAAGAEGPTYSGEEVARLCAQLHDPSPDTRKQAALTLSQAGPGSLDALSARLAMPRHATVLAYRKVLFALWAQLPNWKGTDPMWVTRPEPRWVPPPRVPGQPRAKRPPPHDPESVDWWAALDGLAGHLDEALQLEVDTYVKPDPPEKGAPRPRVVAQPSPSPVPALTVADLEVARSEALEVTVLLRALAHTRRTDAVDPIFKMAFSDDGVFRDEVGRQIRGMESYAIPSLIRLMHIQGPAALHLSKQRRYASYQLDRMDRARPQKAIATAPDDRVRAAIIHAYGEERALDAVEAILEQVDSSAHRVRREARWAWLRYVMGPPPPPAPKRKRKLPGGHLESEEKPDYLTYREIALLALQKQLSTIDGVGPDPKASAAQLTEKLFAHYDALHAAEWDAELKRGQDLDAAGNPKGATDVFGGILAHDPSFVRRAEMAPAFARQGQALYDHGDVAQAVRYFRQAVDLDPEGPGAPRAAARAALCDGRLGGGLPRYKEALRLDPSLDEAKKRLVGAEVNSPGRWPLPLAVGAALLLYGAFVIRRYRRVRTAS